MPGIIRDAVIPSADMGFHPRRRIRFGSFELDVQTGELLRDGAKVDLQDQPFQALALLLERSGEVVTREELSSRLWPEGTFVDFDRGLNKAINKLRVALRDSADKPRFIETLPQRGYRFVAPVEATATQDLEMGAPLAVPSDSAGSSPSGQVAGSRKILPWFIAVLMALVAIATFGIKWRAPEKPVDKPLLRLDLDVSPEEFSQPTISRDGMRIAFVSKNAVALRRLDQMKTTRLAGTEGGFFPFFSPDGQWIGFFANGKLNKVASDGGTPIALCRAAHPGGASWADDDHIIAVLDAHKEGLSRIPAAGGQPQPLTDSRADPSGALTHLWPQALPGGKAVLFAAVNGSAHGSLRILNLSDGKIKTVVENATCGRYLPGGYLVYYWQSKLYAAPVDADRWQTSAPAVPLVSGVSNGGGFGRGEFDVSSSGTLVYRAGTAGTSFVVSWLSPSGKAEPVLAKADSFLTPRLSPDGDRLAVALTEEDKQSLWIYDLKRETWARLTTERAVELLPAWTPDGQFLAFRSGNALAWARSDGSGNVERLAETNMNVAPWSFSSDGRWLCFWPLQPESDLWTVPVERSRGVMALGRPKPLLQRSGSKGAPAVSPDSRWIAYASNESGIFDIYVMPFSPTGGEPTGKWLVSSGGGTSPVWSRNRRELFYQGTDRHVHVAAYSLKGDTFLAEKPRIWSPALLGETGIFNAFDLAPDGNRVIALFAAEEPRANTLAQVLLNLDGELHRTFSPVRN